MVLYTLYLFGTKIHHVYEVCSFGKQIVRSVIYFSKPKKLVYNIQDEIWELISNEEHLPFYDYIVL